MLDRAKVIQALQAKRDLFTADEALLSDLQDQFKAAMTAYHRLESHDILDALQDIPLPGARPTDEHERYDTLRVPFDSAFDNHRQARQWAYDILYGRTVFAADGSQIGTSKDMSIPVAVVQVGWYLNHHTDDGQYEKDVDVQVFTASDMDPTGESTETAIFSDWFVDWQRFNAEIRALIAFMEAHAHQEPAPLCFFDGSLVISFAQMLRPERQRLYINAIKDLLAVSESTQVPVVGFIDTSYASDIAQLLRHLTPGILGTISDAALLRPMLSWGDRSQVFECARDDNLIDKFYSDVYFSYVATNQGNRPARVDFPRWVYEVGRHEDMFDLIRAESIVGLGYPYALETADAVAVLTMEDRDRFYGLFQIFADQENLDLRFSRKAISKRQRRI